MLLVCQLRKRGIVRRSCIFIQCPKCETPCPRVVWEILVMPPVGVTQRESLVDENEHGHFRWIELIQQLVKQRFGNRLFLIGEE